MCQSYDAINTLRNLIGYTYRNDIVILQEVLIVINFNNPTV